MVVVNRIPSFENVESEFRTPNNVIWEYIFTMIQSIIFVHIPPKFHPFLTCHYMYILPLRNIRLQWLFYSHPNRVTQIGQSEDYP